WALREAGVRAVMVNSNPETVSTDFDTSDRLYFEPLDLDGALHVARAEEASGALVQFGGQTAINLAQPLDEHQVTILGSSVEAVVIPGVMQHVERAGVHSGDSYAVYPAQGLERAELDHIVDYTVRIARHLRLRGLVNVQYVVHRGHVYVLEVNPRASRTVPF